MRAGFYRWIWALPAHETWLVLLQIYSGGFNNKLYLALPALLGRLVVGVALASLGAFYRNKSAKEAYLLAEEKERDLMGHDKRATLEGLEEVRNTATKANTAHFPMHFQHRIYDGKVPLTPR